MVVIMPDTKILQSILDGQVSIRQDIKKVEQNLSKEIKINRKRIDKLGLQLARLEDDTPTVEEFDNLDKRVTKLEKQPASA